MRIKYLFLVISWLIYGSFSAFAQNVLYVYKSDGDIISIQEDQIDSIYCSNIIEDGRETSEIISQVIQTKDSTYITLLCDIDSVGFHPQPMEVKDGVTFLDDRLMDYVIRVDYDSLYLVLSHKTPKKLIPWNGEKLVTLKCTPIMGYAFAGVVNDVTTTAEGIVVTCDDADLTEFFKTLYLTTEIGPDSEPFKANARGATVENQNFYQNKWTFDLIKDFGISHSSDNIPPLEISASNLSAEISHFTRVFQSLVISEGRSTQTIKVASNLHAGIDLSFAIRLQGELGPDHMPKIPLYGCPLANVYLSAGPYFKAEAELAADLAFNYDVSVLVELNQDLKTKMVTTGMPKVVSHTKNPLSCEKLLINGKLGMGLFAEIGIAAPYMKLEKLPKACAAIRDKVFYEVEGAYMIHNDDLPKAESETTMYDILRRTKIKQRIKGELDLILGNTTINLLSSSIELSNIDLVPEFKFVCYKRNGSIRLWPTIHTKSNLLLGTTIDCIAKTINGDIISSTKETLERGEQDLDIELMFEDIGEGELQIYPRCTFMGITMLASPAQQALTIDCDIQKIENRDARYSYNESKNLFSIAPTYNMPSYGLSEEDDEIRIWRNNDEYFRIQYENGISYWLSAPDGFENLSLDYTNYVAKLPVEVLIIKWFKLDGSDEWSYLATDYYDHTCIYDEKPSVTLSNAYVTGTLVLETDSAQNVHYKTDYNYTTTWRGLFWMRAWQWEISNGFVFESTGTPFTNFTYNDYHSDGTYDVSSSTGWWSNGEKTHTKHMNIILRDGKEITSNYLYFNEGSIGVSSRSRISSKTILGNGKAGVIVMNENMNFKRDSSIEEQVNDPERDEIAAKYLHR